MQEERLILYWQRTEDSQSALWGFLDRYVGQAEVKEQMDIFINAARNRSEPWITLVFGPPGLGRHPGDIIANELKVAIKTTSGPVLEKAGTGTMLTNLEEGMYFIDEIHRLNPRSRNSVSGHGGLSAGHHDW